MYVTCMSLVCACMSPCMSHVCHMYVHVCHMYHIVCACMSLVCHMLYVTCMSHVCHMYVHVCMHVRLTCSTVAGICMDYVRLEGSCKARDGGEGQEGVVSAGLEKEPYSCERLNHIRGGFTPLTTPHPVLHFDFSQPQVHNKWAWHCGRGFSAQQNHVSDPTSVESLSRFCDVRRTPGCSGCLVRPSALRGRLSLHVPQLGPLVGAGRLSRFPPTTTTAPCGGEGGGGGGGDEGGVGGRRHPTRLQLRDAARYRGRDRASPVHSSVPQQPTTTAGLLHGEKRSASAERFPVHVQPPASSLADSN